MNVINRRKVTAFVLVTASALVAATGNWDPDVLAGWAVAVGWITVVAVLIRLVTSTQHG